MKTLAFLLAALVLVPAVADEPLRDLNKIEQALKANPDDPMLHYAKMRALFAEGREQQAIDHGAVAIAKFKAAGNRLAWIGVGSIKTKRYRIDVHYNMGPKERAERKDGIVRPYSFRVWTKDDQPALVRVIDFELGYFNGEVVTAAVGEMTGSGHANFGVVDPKSDFAAIKQKVLKILDEEEVKADAAEGDAEQSER